MKQLKNIRKITFDTSTLILRRLNEVSIPKKVTGISCKEEKSLIGSKIGSNLGQLDSKWLLRRRHKRKILEQQYFHLDMNQGFQTKKSFEVESPAAAKHM